MSEAVSQGEAEGSEGRARRSCCRDQLLPVGNIRFRTPEKKTGFDVVESSPKNGEQVRMPGGKRRKKPTS